MAKDILRGQTLSFPKYTGLYRDYRRIMEKKMETIGIRVHIRGQELFWQIITALAGLQPCARLPAKGCDRTLQIHTVHTRAVLRTCYWQAPDKIARHMKGITQITGLEKQPHSLAHVLQDFGTEILVQRCGGQIFTCERQHLSPLTVFPNICQRISNTPRSGEGLGARLEQSPGLSVP